nr:adenylate/guanylate cyclase domain-containing protein [uncultured Flavobacterium sp.]
MAIKTKLAEIENDVIDVINTDFVYNNTIYIPQRDDAQLTYESGIQKKGKAIKTCVLYVDIRNSVGLTEKHHNITMGKIYTAFTKAVLKVARHHNGHIRNIIGDRVMIVFPVKDCFTNAVDCAISINHIAQYIINNQFKYVDFKCGIGIDYGDLRIIKVGIQRNGTENAENKGLVWAGYPANIASRLTDSANKVVKETYYEVVRNPINYLYKFGGFKMPFSSNPIPNNQPYYSNNIETVVMNADEFADNIRSHKSGELFMLGGKLINFSKKENIYNYSPILMTEEVYNGFKSNNPTRNSIINKYWKEQPHQIKNYKGKLFGGDVHWL